LGEVMIVGLDFGDIQLHRKSEAKTKTSRLPADACPSVSLERTIRTVEGDKYAGSGGTRAQRKGRNQDA
jgi:hypothetical protein